MTALLNIKHLLLDLQLLVREGGGGNQIIQISVFHLDQVRLMQHYVIHWYFELPPCYKHPEPEMLHASHGYETVSGSDVSI